MIFKSIRSELSFVIVVTGIVIGMGVGYFIYSQNINKAVESARAQIKTTMAFVKASRNYVRKTLRPKINELLQAGCTDEDFILEGQSSSFFTASIFNMVNEEIPYMSLRQVAIDPLNPKNTPNDTEMWVIAYLRDNKKKEFEGITVHNGENYYIKAFAVIPKAKCLKCHGVVKDMPKAIRKLYSPTKDPLWKVGDVQGAVVVYVPFEEIVAQARMDGIIQGGAVGGVFIVMSGVILLLLQYRVFGPINALRQRAEEISKGDVDKPIPHQSENEIGKLAQAIERMRVSIKKVMEMMG